MGEVTEELYRAIAVYCLFSWRRQDEWCKRSGGKDAFYPLGREITNNPSPESNEAGSHVYL